MHPGLTLGYWLTLHGLVVVLGLGVYVMASRALYQRRHPSAAIAWVVMLTLLPYVALPLYFMFGSRKVAGRQGPLPVTPAKLVGVGLPSTASVPSAWRSTLWPAGGAATGRPSP